MVSRFTGESLKFIINVNDKYNLTVKNTTTGNNHFIVQGLKPKSMYFFKILAMNSVGSSKFSHVQYSETLPSNLDPLVLPSIINAHFDDLKEAICFKITSHGSVEVTGGLLIRLSLIKTASFMILAKAKFESIDFEFKENYMNTYCILYSQIGT